MTSVAYTINMDTHKYYSKQTDPPCPSALDVIKSRRTSQTFDPTRPLPDELLRQVLHLATFAPSGDNLQPWRFLVVRSKRNRERLKQTVHGQKIVVDAPVSVIVLAYLNAHRTDLAAVVEEQVRRGLLDPDEAAGVLGRAFAAGERRTDRASRALRSAMTAASTLMLAAEAMGVASAWVDGVDLEKLNAAFGVPDDHRFCALIALGFADASTPFPGRFALEHVCFEEHFGQPWTLGEPAG
ncbi:MAG: nitroreductase family protein [Isosphaeraceae bacterium]